MDVTVLLRDLNKTETDDLITPNYFGTLDPMRRRRLLHNVKISSSKRGALSGERLI